MFTTTAAEKTAMGAVDGEAGVAVDQRHASSAAQGIVGHEDAASLSLYSRPRIATSNVGTR